MKRGDVVELDWPFSDRSGMKVRPALVVQADYLDGITDDRILVRIGSKIHGITGTEVILDPAQEPLSRLRKKCVAACADILTFDQSLILRKIGVLSDATMLVVDECLKSALGFS
jgi:mRNA-degrading endonuclease toxin of MazEF toxin-antitoxin module